jgi:hypothetical protein
MTISWTIAQLDRKISHGLVTYESLTEAQVIAWVKDKLDVEAIKAGLQSHIDGQKNPVIAKGVPWNGQSTDI